MNCANVWRKNKVTFLVLFVLTMLVVSTMSACGNKSHSKALSYVLEEDPLSLDPQVASDFSSRVIIMNTFEGLTRLDKSGQATPGVAYTWESNDNCTVYTFHLRENAKWSDPDATPLTAYDFVYGISRAISKETVCERVQLLYCIKNAAQANQAKSPLSAIGVKAIDAYTLMFELVSSYEDFPILVSKMPFMPCNEKFFAACSGSYGREVKSVISNGPYRLKSWDQGKGISLIKNDAYSGEHIPECTSLSFAIRGKMGDDPIELIKKGRMSASQIQGEDLVRARQFGLNLSSFDDMQWGIVLNYSDDTCFCNEKMRKAFLMAINREEIFLSLSSELYDITDQIILSNSMISGKNYREAVGSMCKMTYDLKAAKALFSEGLKEMGLTECPNVTLVYPCDGSLKMIVNKLLSSWNDAFGVFFNVKAEPYGKLNQQILAGDYRVALYYVKPSSADPCELLQEFTSKSNRNISRMNDSVYDTLVQDFNEAYSVQMKMEKVALAEKRLSDNAVFYPLYTGSRYFACAKNLSGIIFHPYDEGIDFTNVRIA